MEEPHPASVPAPAARPAPQFYERHERVIAIGAFAAGFVFDVLTLPRVDSWLAIAQQAIYIAAITAVLAHMLLEQAAPAAAAGPAAGPRHWYRRYRNVCVHLLFGSLLNLYTIYYFKSASFFASFAFLIVLVLLLAVNESRRFRASGLAFKFALLALCVLSFAAQVIPVVVGSIGPLVFLAAMLAGAMIMTGVAAGIAAAPGCAPLARRQVLAPLGVVLALFLASYLLRLTPPVPLSMPFIGIYHAVERTAQGYRLAHERRGWRFWEIGDQDFRAQPGDRVYVFFRIHSPTHFSDEVLVRWLYRDRAAGWAPQGAVRVGITGGRAEGFRGYAWKRNYRPGRWRVQVETTDGREIGRIYFRLALVPPAPRRFAIEVQ
ncbi:MAG: DUF2914 domain-containing protein [Burkholderiales bacterium]|nr:DUF2914 domain-containing protein [Burkholderiales bacterium]